MTCRHVLDLIDAGPLTDASQAHCERARSHAATCPTCGPALAASRAVTAGLRALADPAPPTTLTRAVMARVAAVDLRESATHAVTGRRAHITAPDSLDVASCVGMALGAATIVASSDVVRVWTGGDVDGVRRPAVLLCGLALYVTGLFAWPRRRRV